MIGKSLCHNPENQLDGPGGSLPSELGLPSKTSKSKHADFHSLKGVSLAEHNPPPPHPSSSIDSIPNGIGL